jgi:SSS family solute:Na+ symporter
MMKLISGQLYQYLQSVQAYISPPVAAVFLLGITWRRANALGAMMALATGFVLGALRLVAELSKDHLGGAALAYAEVNFLHFAVLLCAVCSAVLVVVSLLTPAPDAKQLEGLTFATTPTTSGEGESRWRIRDRWASALLVALVGGVWLYFSPWVQG